MSTQSPDQLQNHHAFRWNYSEFDDANFQLHGRTLYSVFILFAVILIVTVVFLYGRWIGRFFPSPQRGFHAPPSQCRGLDPASIGQLPVLVYSKVSGEYAAEAECCICLGMFGDKDGVKVLPECRHCFHSGCVDQWLMVHSTCPICRGFVRIDSPV